MELLYKNNKYKFIPDEVISFSDVKYLDKVLENDSFTKYKAITMIYGEMIICNDINKLKIKNKKIQNENYKKYLDFISNRDIEKDRWIYNIIDGLYEQESIVYRDNTFIIIPTFEWNKDINKLHILSIPIDKKYRTLRDLRKKDIPLLKYMKKNTLIKINELYKLTENDLKIFIHYTPSTYHLHIHYVNINYKECNSSIEYSHELDNVIFNLNLDDEYYKKILLNRET